MERAWPLEGHIVRVGTVPAAGALLVIVFGFRLQLNMTAGMLTVQPTMFMHCSRISAHTLLYHMLVNFMRRRSQDAGVNGGHGKYFVGPAEASGGARFWHVSVTPRSQWPAQPSAHVGTVLRPLSVKRAKMPQQCT